MLKNILDSNIYDVLTNKVGLDNIYEIRFRANAPTTVISSGQVYFLSLSGLSYNCEQAIVLSSQQIEEIIYKASEFSIYSISEELKQGFIVLNNGVRIGISGHVIMENQNVKTITNFSSLNIRIPHVVKGVSKQVFDILVKDTEIFNTLIVSPPGQGKTTFLRDFAYMLYKNNYLFNVLVLDERGEIAGKNPNLYLGGGCDVLSFCSKEIGFVQGIRAMNPDIIMTDELGFKKDFEAVSYASTCGVKVVATIHAKTLEDLKRKEEFKLVQNVFERYVILKPYGQAGQVEGVFDQSFNQIRGSR